MKMDLYGEKSKSIRQKLVIHTIEVLLLCLSYWILFQSGGNWVGDNLNTTNAVGNIDRRIIIFIFNIIIFLRLAYIMFFILERKIPWEESISVPFAFAIYFIGFPLFVLPISKPIDTLDFFAISIFVIGCVLNSGGEILRKKWKRKPENKGQIYTKDFFKYAQLLPKLTGFPKFQSIVYCCVFFFIPQQLFSQIQNTPPVANKIPFKISINGEVRIDNYYWLKNKDSTAVINHLKKENEYANKNDYDTMVVAKQIISEFKKYFYKQANVPSLMPLDSIHNGFMIIDINKNNKSTYPFLCKRNLSTNKLDSLINIDSIARKYKYFNYKISYNSYYSAAAFLIDTSGAESYSCTFLNLLTSEWYKEKIPRITNYCEWADNVLSFLYVTVDSFNLRWNKIHLHKLGNLIVEDKLIYEEKKPNLSYFYYKR